jgi:hypothetical protein
LFLQEFKAVFAPLNFLVTATVSMNETIASQSYDVCELTTNLDLVQVMGYYLKCPSDKNVFSPGNYGLNFVSSVGSKMLKLSFNCTNNYLYLFLGQRIELLE